METASIGSKDERLITRLSGSVLFAYLTSGELADIVGMVSRVRLKKGEVLFREGEAGNELYLVDDGRIAISKVVKGNLEQVLAHMVPGDYFGEMALLEQIPRTASAQAEEDSVLLRICREDLFAMMERQPRAAAKIMFNLLHTFTNRLQSTNDQLRETVRWGLEATGFRPEE